MHGDRRSKLVLAIMTLHEVISDSIAGIGLCFLVGYARSAASQAAEAASQVKESQRQTKAIEEQVKASLQLISISQAQVEVAKKQAEESARPIITVEKLEFEGQSKRFRLRNVGSGAAVKLAHDHIRTVFALGDQPLGAGQSTDIQFEAGPNFELDIVYSSIYGRTSRTLVKVYTEMLMISYFPDYKLR